MEPVLKTTNLTKSFGGLYALNNLNLELPAGKIVGLLGPNGSGKTTLLKLTAGLLSPTRGELRVCGKEVGVETKSMVSYLPDRTYFSKNQKISELMDYFQDFYQDFDRERAEGMLAVLGLQTNMRFKQLSKGNKEKVQLVLVMSRRARLYLLDEPIGGVDPATRDYILNTIVNNFDPSATVLISTHLIADVEQVLDEYIFLLNGQIQSSGNVKQTVEETGKTIDQTFREVFRCSAGY